VIACLIKIVAIKREVMLTALPNYFSKNKKGSGLSSFFLSEHCISNIF
jgi:hypothetical protein